MSVALKATSRLDNYLQIYFIETCMDMQEIQLYAQNFNMHVVCLQLDMQKATTGEVRFIDKTKQSN